MKWKLTTLHPGTKEAKQLQRIVKCFVKKIIEENPGYSFSIENKKLPYA